MSAFTMIPQPARCEKAEGRLTIAPYYACADAALLPVCEVFSDAADRIHGVFFSDAGSAQTALDPALAVNDYVAAFAEGSKDAGAAASGIIRFAFDAALAADEYAIDITDAGCSVKAGGMESANYAAATLVQLLEKDGDVLSLPKGHIQDKPVSEWRGLMVDLARQWHPVEYLFRYIDLCWLYKIDRLQLHFTDDQSYTLPSKAFPMLPTQGRTYTVAQLNALREYAAARGVMLVPEVDFPGHSLQFNTRLPEIFGTQHVSCCEEKTFAAIGTLLDEVFALFPDAPYFHLGGDEAQLELWNECPGCVAYREEHGLPDVHAQYAHYVDRIARMVLERGKTPVAWEGFAKEYNHMVTKELLVFSWENYYQIAPELVEGGFTIINASWKPNYVVTPAAMWSREEILEWNPRRWTHFWEKSKAFNTWISVSDEAPVLGGQLCAWGDRLTQYTTRHGGAREEFANVAQRLPAVAERCWQPNGCVAEDAVWEAAAAMAAKLTGIG